MFSRPLRLSLRVTVSLLALAAVTVLFAAFLSANPTTVALSYLLLILFVATEWGVVEATVIAVGASLCFNLFFLPPVGQLSIADPENWVSFVAFILTALVVSQLSGRARARHLDAVSRQRDLERLYTLSRGLLLTDDAMSAPAGIARQIAEAFELESLALYDHHAGLVARAGRRDVPGVDDKLREVVRQAVTLREPSGLVVTAIRLGGAPIGSLAILGGALSDTVLQSVANLAAIGLERARGREAALTFAAAQRSEALRTALLDSVAHELKTPLTSIRAAIGGLAAGDADPSRRELVAIIDEESARLQGLVTDAIQMFRVEAGDFEVHRDRHRLRELVDGTIRDVRSRAGNRPVANTVDAAIVVDVDASLVGLVLRQLLDNALKYSTPASPIEIGAVAGPVVDLVVRNAGAAIPAHERDRIFERFYRGALATQVPGTGMGLAIVRQIARAHGGDVAVSSDERGTEVHVSLPARAGAV